MEFQSVWPGVVPAIMLATRSRLSEKNIHIIEPTVANTTNPAEPEQVVARGERIGTDGEQHQQHRDVVVTARVSNCGITCRRKSTTRLAT